MKNRKISYQKALRKQRIDKEVHGKFCPPWYNNLHQYSKNKIHCSCGLCQVKTGRHGYTITDKKKIDSCNNQLIDFYNIL